MAESTDRAGARGSGGESPRAANAFDFGRGGERAGVAESLSTVAETVRRILRADTASIASFSVADRTITWLATSGFQTVEAEGGIVNPLRGEFAERAAEADDTATIIEERGAAGDPPTRQLALHYAEGVLDVA